jgi:N-acetylglucosaminyldiphosphoundecaprenol N-acetyl-beta-D-mannosaminyltransferase
MRDDRVTILGCEIDRLTFADTVERCARAIEANEFVQQVSINAAKVVALQTDGELRRMVDRAEIVNPDGVSVVWASRVVGRRLPERVTGIDLMHALLGLAARRGYPVYILGASREMLEEATARLRGGHPGLVVAGRRDGYFDDSEAAGVRDEIRATGARMLFVAMGSPRTEHWLHEHARGTGVSLAMGVGGAIDVVAGKVRRAPAPMRRLGLEWLFRLAQEPRRLARRNLASVEFLLLFARSLLAGRRGR